MPVHIETITQNTKPLDEKIFELLSANPDQFYTTAEITSELQEFTGFTSLGSKVGPNAMLLGLLADLAFHKEVGAFTRDRQEQIAMALTSLSETNRIRCIDYQGSLRFGVAKTIPGWVAQPKLLKG